MSVVVRLILALSLISQGLPFPGPGMPASGGGGSNPTFVSDWGTFSTSCTSCTLTVAPTAGDKFFVVGCNTTTTSPPSSVTDNLSTTYTLDGRDTSGDCGHWHLDNAPSGITQLTFTQASGGFAGFGLDFSNMGTASSFDQYVGSGTTNTSGNWSSVSTITTTHANEVIVASLYCNATSNCGITYNSPWTVPAHGNQIMSGIGDNTVLAYQIVSSTNTYGSSGTYTSGPHRATLASYFK